SDFIAAARRAAQAAAAEADALKRQSTMGGPVKALRIGDLLKARRKPILMAAAAIMLALAGLQLGKAFFSDPAPVASNDAAPVIAAQPVETASLNAPAEPKTIAEPKAASAAQETPTRAVRQAEPVRDAAPAQTAAVPPTDADMVKQAAGATYNIPADAGPQALRDAAAGGDAKALFEVGSRYAESRGVKEDMKAAAKWYEKAAELGLAPAEYRIGNFYEKGIGVARDIKKAKTYYQLAAEQGNASAMHNLAVLFAMAADGVTDNESAAHWFQAAADRGVKDSQFNLGILAAKGVGMKQNLEESYKWFALVAKTGDKDAASKRDEIANALRPEQLERARAAAELWKAKPIDQAANSVDIPESWQEGTPQTTASIDMKKAVKNIQLILNKNGYEAGGADGVMGDKTKTAIMAFQTDNKMKPTGEVDEQLVKALLARK
ncbi:MAG: peptidoglycan-binding protein, partial [Mesorhizobium sp.]